MSIASTGFGVDRISRQDEGKSLFDEAKNAVTSSQTWYQGDLMCFDTSLNVIRAVSATADAATFIGIADNTVLNGQLLGPYTGLTPVDGAQVSPGIVGPKYGCWANMKLNVGDVFTVGAKVYLSTDTQTVTVTNPGDGNYIGIFMDPGLTAVSGSTGNVLIGARYPSATGTGLVF